MLDKFLKESTLKRSTVIPNSSFNGARSFINTALVTDSVNYNDDLRRSRIQNLPNYKKVGLGENQQFVIVFQTIEIERLSNQVQVLRVNLKQAERKIFAGQNYQVQIKELTEKCFSYESTLEQFREQYEKLNKICETLYHQNETLKAQLSQMDFSLKQKYESEKQKNQELLNQIDKWKNRFQAGEKSKQKELQDLRNLMDNQRKSMIDREIRQTTIRFQNQRGALQAQIRKCREMLGNRNSEIEALKQKCQRYEIQAVQLRSCQQVNDQLENRLAMVANELNRLTEMIRHKDEEIDHFKKRQYELGLKLKEQQEWENDNRTLRAHLQAKVKEIQEWRLKLARLEEEVVRGREMAHYNQELNEKLDLASKELQRLDGLLRNKMNQIEQWKQRLASKEAELGQLRNLENDVAQYEAKLNMVKAENDRINGILKARLQEIQTWKRKNGDLQALLSRMSLMQEDKKMLEQKFNSNIKNIQELNFAISRLENDNSNLRKYEQRCRELEVKLQALIKQVQRLNQLLRGKDQEMNDSRVRHNQMQNKLDEFKNIEVVLKDFQNKVALMTQEIDRLNNLIKDQNKEIDNLQQQKIQLHSTITQLKNYETKLQENDHIIANQKNNIEQAKKEIQAWQNKARNSQNRARQLQNNLYNVSQEKQKVNGMARNKSQQADALRGKVDSLTSELNKLGDLGMAYGQLQKQSMMLQAEIENYDRRARDLQTQLTRQRSSNQQLKNKLSQANSGLEQARQQARNNDGRRSKEFSEVQQLFSRLQSKFKSKEEEAQGLSLKLSQLESQCSNLMKEYNRLLEAVEKSLRQQEALVKKIQEYQDYARRIHILGGQIDRLSEENKRLQEDNRNMRYKYANQMSLQKTEQEYQMKIVLMGVEIESLRERISKREMTMDEMRKSIFQPIRRV